MSALKRKLRKGLLVCASFALVGCETLPALTQLAIAFGQDLIAAAAVNHTPRYATQVEALLSALATQTTGMQMQPVLAQSGYVAPQPKYLRPNREVVTPEYEDLSRYDDTGYAEQGPGYQDQGYQNQGYQDQTYQDQTYQDQGYQDQGYQDQEYQDQGYQDSGYTDSDYAQQDQGYPDSGYADQGYDDATYDQQTYDDADYARDGDYAQEDLSQYDTDTSYSLAEPDETITPRGALPIGIQATLLAQRAGTQTLVAIEDGATLRDGGNDPAAGDLLKIHVETNCACFLYVIGIDSTGYVARIYPDPEEGHQNPVAPAQAMTIPSGDNWWALDNFKGVEQVYFLASRQPRADVEQLLTDLAGVRKTVSPDSYQPVAEPAIVPPTRGLVKVKAKPAMLSGLPAQQTPLEPALFTTQSPTNELLITRWFRHE